MSLLHIGFGPWAASCALGFEQAGIDQLLLVDGDKDARAAMVLNKSWPVSEAVAPEGLAHCKGMADIVSMPIDKQTAGQAAAFIGTLLPALFILYGDGRIAKKGNDIADASALEASLQDLGYDLWDKVFRTCSYGVAQDRRDFVIVGMHGGLPDELSYRFPQKDLQGHFTIRRALAGVPSGTGLQYTAKQKEILDTVAQGGNWASLEAPIAERYMGGAYFADVPRKGYAARTKMDGLAQRLSANVVSRPVGLCHPTETRPFTVRECARLNGFPDWWEFKGNVESQYRQACGGLPVRFAYRLGLQAWEALGQP